MTSVDTLCFRFSVPCRSRYSSGFLIAFDCRSLFHVVRLDLALCSGYTTLFVVVFRSFGFISHLTSKSSLQVCSLGPVLCYLLVYICDICYISCVCYFAFPWLAFPKLEINIYVVMVL
jgi:hypothetical protein